MSAAALAGPALPPAAYLVALASLPRMGPRRLRALLAGRLPAEAWALVLDGRPARVPEVAETLAPDGPDLVRRWVARARAVDVGERWNAHRSAGIHVLTEDDPRYPECLRADLEPPPVLFARGHLEAADGPCVAVVGTRRCTTYGREVAAELGHDLAAAGVRVVSGLALGIDAAAHTGALDARAAPVVGVVGNGLDVVYPRSHGRLYQVVGERGLLLSEHPLRAQPRGWTFPARNRIVAALSLGVVVVESRTTGGSQYTVDEAMDRDLPVLAVPGSVRSPASAGPNQLIHQGAAPVRDATDVLVALGLPQPTRSVDRRGDGAPRGGADEPDVPPVRPEWRAVLDGLGWEPTSLEQAVLRTGLELGALHAALTGLEEAGLVRWEGSWIERCARSRR